MSEEQKAAPRVPTTHYAPKEGKTPKRFILPVVVVLLVVIIFVGGWFMWSKTQNSAVAIDNGKYQAVFFTNGQVYFGKLQPFNNDYLKLTDIYYLQTQNSTGGEAASSNPQEAAKTDQGSVQLIKLGDEIHGPEDEMVISKDQVLFYENLKTDSKVVQSIDKQKNS